MPLQSPVVTSESVFAANESPLPIVALVSAPVPLPVKMPPRVVEPVPPKFTARVEVPATTPVEFVTRREFWMLETVRFEVLAEPVYIVPVAVMFVVEAPPYRLVQPVKVEEA